MKYIYLTIFSLLFVAAGAFAQKRTLTIPVHNYPDSYLESMSQSHIQNSDKEAVTVRPVSQVPNLVRGGGALWSEDFGGGFPAGWVSDDQSGICPWKWSTNGSHGNFNGTNAGDYADAINSTTAGNGFLIVDPDSANHFTYGQPSGTTYQYLDSYFATTQIDLGASYSSLLLEFEQNFRFNNSVDLVVQVSSDSTNWIDYNVQGGATNNTESDDPDLVSINISGAIGASQTLYLRIGWSARVYFWMIDDMRIVEGLGNDLTVTNVWHGDIVNAWEYQKIPLSQTQEVVIGAACLNLGGNTQPNAVYTYDISDGANSVASGTFNANTTSIASTGGDTTWFSTGYTPSALGDYTVTVSVSSDSLDELTSNDEGMSVFEVSDFIYAHDDEDNIEFQVNGGNDANDDANEYKLGMYYEVVDDVNLTSVQVAFGNNTTTSTCVVEVFDASDLNSPIVQEIYDILPADISAGAVPTYVNIFIDGGDGIDLIGGTAYLVSVSNTGVGEELWILASDRDDDSGQLRYGPFGVGGAIDWYTGYTTSPLVRMNTDPAVGIAEAELEENGFGIYPNPASDQVTIAFADNVDFQSITLVDLGGRIVKQLDDSYASNSSKVILTTEGIASGAYFVNVLSSRGVSTQRLIIE